MDEISVRGYHVYEAIWHAVVGETLACEREPRNIHDRYTVAVKKDRNHIDNLPRIVSRLCSLFMKRGGSIHCTVSGMRRYSADLPQGGMEIPCFVVFKASPSKLMKLKIIKSITL